MKLYWQLHFEQFSNEDLLRDSTNPLWDYENELIEGPLLDIGCGQSEVLLRFATTARALYALDTVPLQLDLLKKRVLTQPSANLANWYFLEQAFPATPLPNHQYALIVLSNLLHFFPLAECLPLGTILLGSTAPGSLVYV
jgi:SAM-dependent methyltransferase